MDGAAVLTSIMIFSAICTISGLAPIEAPGIMPPSSVIALAWSLCQCDFLLVSVLCLGSYLNYCDIESVVVLLVLGVEAVEKILRKHRQVLIEELNVVVVDSLCDIFADLVRSTSLDHVKLSPAVLCLGSRTGANEEVVLELSLEIVLLDMVGEGGGDLPT